jgi:hypothetical protein
LPVLTEWFCGEQGVGKNKLVDRLLQLLNAEREYIQLHRDTTLTQLTVVPHLVDGRVVYEDSPLGESCRCATTVSLVPLTVTFLGWRCSARGTERKDLGGG